MFFFLVGFEKYMNRLCLTNHPMQQLSSLDKTREALQ